jgi:hypothetical protein
VRPNRAQIVKNSAALAQRLASAPFYRRAAADKPKREISGLVLLREQPAFAGNCETEMEKGCGFPSIVSADPY